MRALTAFVEQRLATEGVIAVNALIATFLILYCARDNETAPLEPQEHYGKLIRRTVIAGLACWVLFTACFTTVVRGVYGNQHDGWGARNLRLGPEADWRLKPILKNKQHR
jgi:hypothetical protein